MSVSYGTLILDEADSGGNLIVRGSATIALSQRVPDAGDDLIFGQAPVTGAFRAGGAPSVRIPFNDTFGPQQDDGTPGSTYGITYNGVPGSPAQWSFYFISTNGDEQRLSALASVPAAQPGRQYVPLPQNTPVEGNVLEVATVSPLTVQWQASSAEDKNYTQDFTVSSTVDVAHNLDKYPAVTVFDSAGSAVIGDVAYTDLNNLTLTFSAPFSGTVTCN